ncbi:hypothetical protein Agub_g1693 [Astrephomene gubernaculifera]|uniref:Uncharacterized protein n=1 Tax=Astrephomene gubernaculifera TaxID=47775 RepID=A0AAD3DFW8_9CHLO|nr:hypothetical protein Agub_g1693 [Astrephomene gubernaculifera]
MTSLAGVQGWAFNEVAMNNFVQPEDLAGWLDFSQEGARGAAISCIEPASARFSLDEDCAFVLAADFPEAQGPLPLGLGAHQRFATDGGFASTTSAEFLNTLGGSEDMTPRMTPFSELCPSVLEPEEELPTSAVAKTTSKSTGRAARRGPAHKGGRRGVAKRSARGHAAAAPGPVSLLYKGTIGGSGTMQARSLPWTLSLQCLNRELAVSEEAWPEADS